MKGLLAATMLMAGLSAPATAQDYRDRPASDELIYFLLPDRFENGDPANDLGGLKGGRLDHGFDPTAKGFFLGGDLKGLTNRLDYIQGMGATAIWLGPIYRNKPVQGPKGEESAGYHGYWITDFTTVDPHFGTEADLKAFIAAAHARGMKVYLDIITNHTADVIRYRECPDTACAYRSRADYPFTRRGGPRGEPINDRFLGDAAEHQTAENYARLSDPRWAYTPYVPKGEERVKKPDWLNDPIYYNNRGDSIFKGESSILGDFVGLDDVMTAHPRVVQGMIDIYGGWIDRFGVDGFRIDTARHVNPEFWQAFVPAMLARAKANGIPNFHIFGEVLDPDAGSLARFTHVDRFPALLDFAFQSAVQKVVAEGAPPSGLTRLFYMDPLYAGGEGVPLQLPTFLGNHDIGRFSTFVRKANPDASDAEQLARVKLAHSMLLLLRGVPTIYSGDEQGFVGDGHDQDAREPLFPSQVAVYNDNRLLGTAATTASANFDTAHPLYRHIAALAKLRAIEPSLRGGVQRVLNADEEPGLFAVARRLPEGNRGPFIDTIIAFNTSSKPLKANVMIDPRIEVTKSLWGNCAQPSAPGTLPVEIEPFGTLVCAGAVAVQ
ncbi:alpha-amylase [Sandaracinobacter neustonicus]|uniref:Alpha-amylase n=1 Tax=Sandaracinobacter neustonicus TaxID=1715348 RepID=A0A501XY35_9SPHN|nr:alpha-amylase family glycosyl hydrolase [Sandaracinobacter neustonicus]TPE64984.1 alpha-amylase [Sandaracinobacter neustonicus]